MNSKTLILALLATAALTSTSVAADVLVVGEQVPHFTGNTVAEKRWEGAYVGVTGGRAFGNVQDVANSKAALQDTEGLFAGVHAGYNWQLDNNIVFGLEGDVVVGGPSVEWANPAPGAFYGSDVVNGSASLRARLGYNINDTLLPYVTGGVVAAHTTNTLGCNYTGNTASACTAAIGANDLESSQFVLGYTVGAGLEVALTDNLSARTEYRYTKYQDSNVVLNGPSTFASDDHSVRIGLSYKF